MEISRKIYNELYESQKKETGIKYPHTFDKKVLFPVPDAVLSVLSNLIADTIIKDKNKLSQYIELVPMVENKEGKLFMPAYGNSRIAFVNEIVEKWKYDYSILKDIIQWEENAIDEIYTTEDLAYDDVDLEHQGSNKLKFFIEYNKKLVSAMKSSLKFGENFSEKEQYRKRIKAINRNLKKIGDKSYEVLSDGVKEHINWVVFMAKYLDEQIRFNMINQSRAKILLGFSPDVHFKQMWHHIGEIKDIDQEKFSLPEFPYILEYNQEVFAFSDWLCHGIWHSFFSTPEFLITEKEEGEFVITIRDPQKVNVRYLRRIEKVYSKIREKRKYPVSSWGEKSGRKRMLKERDRILQMHYRQLRDEKPNKSAELQLQRIIDQLSPEYGSISLERAKRIVYKRK